MPTLTKQTTLFFPGGSLTSTKSASGGGGPNVTAESIAAESTTRIMPGRIDISALTGIIIQATVACTVVTNKKHKQTATVSGAIEAAGAGNAEVVVTAADMPNSPKTLSVAVANNDTAAQVAGKIRTALAADADVTAFWDVSGSGADVVLTTRRPEATDATQSISIDDDTSVGLDPVTSVGSMTAGDDTIELNANDPYDWIDPDYNDLLLTADVESFDVTVAGETAGTFSCQGTVDVTP